MNALLNFSHVFASHPLTRHAQLAAWLRLAAWFVKSRLNDSVDVPWVGGQHLIVRRGMTGATGNVYLGLHEFMGMALTLHFLRAGDLALDIGANAGSYTVLSSGVCRAETWAFEPDPEALRNLERNVKVNDLGTLVRIIPCALGPAEGTVLFTRGEDATNRVVSSGGANVRLVRQRALDEVLGGRTPIMMKLDVEGYEEQVLRGARNAFAGPSLKVMALEGTSPWVREQLAVHGFERAFYDPFTRTLQRTSNELAYSNGEWTPSNEFYVRDWEFVALRLRQARPIEVLGQLV